MSAPFPEEDLPAILDAIARVLRNGPLILGPRAAELEAEWARRFGARHAVALSSCTAALEIAFRFARVAGREVIVPTNTFIAAAGAARAAGARVVFADVDARDLNLSVEDVLGRMNERTAAVTVVHIAGFIPHRFAELRAACRARRVALIEDCAHAHGATLDGRPAGSLADAGCFSLYATKILTCGVGGVLTTDSEDLAAFARKLRNHGQGAAGELIGGGNDWLMDEVRAVLALAQLRRLDEWLARRRAVAARYQELLAACGRYALPRLAPGSAPACYAYPILLPTGIPRDAVRAALATRHGVETGTLYSPPAHLLPIFGAPAVALPVAEALLPRQLCLPVSAAMIPSDAERVARALEDVVGAYYR